MIVGRIDPQGHVTEFRKLLDHEDVLTRWRAANVLANIKDTASVAKIIPLLQEKNRDVWKGTIHTLGIIGDKSAAPHLMPFLKHKDVFY